MLQVSKIAVISFVIALATLPNVHADDDTTTPTPITSTASTAVQNTTKFEWNKSIKVKNTDLCTLCDCFYDELLIDCSYRNWSRWLTNEELSALHNDAFEQLNLEGNRLTTIPEFPELITLRVLNFAGNAIVNITHGAFAKLTSLQRLDLSGNQLTTKTLQPEIFRGKYSPTLYQPMTNLTHLNLAGNQLHSLQADVFNHFPHIEVLNLSSNFFEHIDDLSKIAISSLGYVREMDLSDMALKDLPEFLFNLHKTDLKVLHLSKNRFVQIPHDALAKAINLEELYLDANPFTVLNKENNFPNMPSLKELHLNHCPNLTTVGADAMNRLTNLTKLYMTNNPHLNELHANAFAYFESASLNVSFPPLKLISLENNNISEFSSHLLGDWTSIDKISLRNNPWKCSCQNNFLINKLVPMLRKSNPELLDGVWCSKPAALKGVELRSFNMIGGPQLDCHSDGAPFDSNVLTGMLIGVLMSVPLAFIFFIVYRRGCFGFVNVNRFGRSHAAFYNRAGNDDFM